MGNSAGITCQEFRLYTDTQDNLGWKIWVALMEKSNPTADKHASLQMPISAHL